MNAPSLAESVSQQHRMPSVLASWLISIALGATLIECIWSVRGNPDAGLIRVVAFVFCITVAHLVAAVWTPDKEMPLPLSSAGRRRVSRLLWNNGVVHFIVLLLSSIVLSVGDMWRLFVPMVVGYWVGATTILARRRNQLLPSDLDFLSLGTVATFGLDFILSLITAFVVRILDG